MKSFAIAAAAALLYLTPVGGASAAPLAPAPAVSTENADVTLVGHRHGHRHHGWRHHRGHHHGWHHHHRRHHGWHHHHHRRHYGGPAVRFYY